MPEASPEVTLANWLSATSTFSLTQWLSPKIDAPLCLTVRRRGEGCRERDGVAKKKSGGVCGEGRGRRGEVERETERRG